MTKSFCDKCGKDCTWNVREIKCSNNYYLWLDESSEIKVARDLMLCLDCKMLFEKVIQDFMKTNALSK